MKHFVNERERIVTEAIDAEVALSEGRLARLDGFPSIKVVVRTDIEPSEVAIISGGGAGHEPAHIGFIGDGMLTAAVSGEIFASPSVDAVLAAILAVTGPPGCLLIVKNYTGDRLNFGLAAEKARALGLAVEMVIVADDVALEDAPRPRGLAGTLFVHKVAGYVARLGASLEEVRGAAERVARGVVSIGVSLTSCNIPGQPSLNRIAEGEVELGLGIHGEPGAWTAPLDPIDALTATMAEALEDALGERGAIGMPVALLVNDLGGVPPIEMAIAARSAIGAMRTNDVKLVFGPGRYMTALDMKGFSLSALALAPELEAALMAPVAPRAWPVGRKVGRPAPLGLPVAWGEVASEAPSDDPRARHLLKRICETLIAKQSELDAIDAKVGDGDTGTTLATAARAILEDLDRLPLAQPPLLWAAISRRLATAVGGSSGILLAIFTAAVGARITRASDLAEALAEGIRRVQEYGGAKPGDRTMLDALIPAVEELRAGADLRAAARAAAEGSTKTATMARARAGRSSYVPSTALEGIPDPGAVAVANVFEALAREV